VNCLSQRLLRNEILSIVKIKFGQWI